MLHGAAEESPALYPFFDFVFRLGFVFFVEKCILGSVPNFSLFPLFFPLENRCGNRIPTACGASLPGFLGLMLDQSVMPLSGWFRRLVR
jgi:hypothetical protein